MWRFPGSALRALALAVVPGRTAMAAGLCLLAGITGCRDAVAPVIKTMSAVSATSQDAIAGNAVAQPPTVVVRDSRGEPVGGVRVAFVDTADITPFITHTGADGTASFVWVASAHTGLDHLTVSAEGLGRVDFVANVHAGPPARATPASDLDQVALPAETVLSAPVIQVTDTYGNATSGVNVTFALAGLGGATVANASAVTSATGGATAGVWTLGSAAGAYTLTASVPGTKIAPIVFRALINTPFAASSIAAGGTESCAVASSGGTYCWGRYIAGGQPTATTPSPVVVIAPLVSLTAGEGHACGLTSAGKAYCWGGNASGQIGIGTVSEDEMEPHAVSGGLTFTSLTAGDIFTCGITTDQLAYCWGDNTLGQLGDGTTNGRLVPTAVATTQRFTTMAAGFQHVCAIATTGTTYCWGLNDASQLGAPSTDVCTVPYDDYYYGASTNDVNCSTTPIAPRNAPVGFTALASGSGTCGLFGPGQPYCWGFPGSAGIPNDGLYSSLAVANGVVCGITTDRAIYCWSAGDVYASSAPTPRPLVDAPQRIVAGQGHWCAIDGAGTALCWGDNEDGQLGNSTRTPSTRPLPVATPAP